MKIAYLLSLALSAVLLTGCGTDTAGENDDFDGTDDDIQQTNITLSLHHQGERCLSCHGAGSSNEVHFDSGASIFTSSNAANGDLSKIAQNYSLRLVLSSSSGVENYSLGRGTGNFHVNVNAGVTSYTAEVLDAQGNVVNSSATDSHNSSRFDCNSCHSATGANGAPGRIVTTRTTTVTTPTTQTQPSETPQFAADVKPIVTNKCSGCHGNSGNFSVTNNPPYTGVTMFVNTTTPTSSLLLSKGSGVSHGGGVQLSSSEYTTIRDWISAGALNN